MKNPIKDLLGKAGSPIKSEEDKALENKLSKELNDAFANTLEEKWAGTGFSTADNEPDSPLPISTPEEKWFGAKEYNPNHAAMDKFKTNTPSPKSPEDMEKEYIIEAENKIAELGKRHAENMDEIEKQKGSIKSLEHGNVVINRMIAGKKASLKELSTTPKPKTPKKVGAKTDTVK